MTEWVATTLGGVTDIQTGFPFKSSEFSDVSTDPYLLRGDNVGQGVLRWGGVKRWPTARAAEVADYALQKGDVILAMDRPWIEAGLKWAFVRESDLPAFLVQRVARLRARRGVDQRFIRYVIASRSFTNYVLAVQTGTAIPHISAHQIADYEFVLPPLAQQLAIAEMLGGLDDKIEANHGISETLEAAALVIFKSWFVDFDPVRAKMEGRDPGIAPDIAALFPDHLAQTQDGEVPKGWSLKPLSSLGRFLNGLALQKFPPESNKFLPVIKIAELRAGRWTDGDKASTSIPEECVVEDGDLLFSWSGSLLHRFWSGGRGALNQHLFKVTPLGVSTGFLYEAIGQHMPEFRAIAADKATTMGHIQRRHLDQALVAVAPSSLMNRAGEILDLCHERALLGERQSRTLAAIRDLLLPKLMSGEVRVKDAERLLG